ncbi:hypothetical protein EVAR_84201_1 [Eumeta japonica]|uniref:Uncharacterized protein n=1 Tax=Eumeta variegata TaxID=151549 RepID=A0A4C1S7R2_EUMVA|nr:hypothetical protein EVAR_84201_1 [Eumeta japonica]
MYRYNNLLSVPELRAEPHRREPISPSKPQKNPDQRPAIEELALSKMYFSKMLKFLRVLSFEGPRGHVVTGFSKIFPEMATGKFSFARSYLRQARVECTKQNWVSQISPEIDPQNPTRLSVRPSGAVSERMLDVLRPRELGPRGRGFLIFPISQERATGKIRSQQTGALL